MLRNILSKSELTVGWLSELLEEVEEWEGKTGNLACLACSKASLLKGNKELLVVGNEIYNVTLHKVEETNKETSHSDGLGRLEAINLYFLYNTKKKCCWLDVR